MTNCCYYESMIATVRCHFSLFNEMRFSVNDGDQCHYRLNWFCQKSHSSPSIIKQCGFCLAPSPPLPFNQLADWRGFFVWSNNIAKRDDRFFCCCFSVQISFYWKTHLSKWWLWFPITNWTRSVIIIQNRSSLSRKGSLQSPLLSPDHRSWSIAMETLYVQVQRFT